MNRITVSNVTVTGQKITCDVKAEGPVKESFKLKSFSFDYEANISMEGVPKSIAVLPALGTLLPLSWLFDAVLEVEECDADFYRSIPDIKRGYMNMYPTVSFAGELKVGKICENHHEDASGSMTFFSGGLDSHDTAIRHAAEKPALLILRGADISIRPGDDAGWEEILRQVDHLAGELGSVRYSVVTNFRNVLKYRFLNEWTAGAAGTEGTYWYCFQHGLAFATHAAPIAWQKKLETVYIASSYTENEEGMTTCASDPSIDNFVRFCDAHISHDGYEYNRNDKLDHVAAWRRKTGADVYLRVCHSKPKGSKDKNGRNCCKCEKCYRTILGLYAIKEDPARYGFDYGDFDKLANEIHNKAFRIVRLFNLRYIPIIQKMKENYKPEEVPESMKWFYNFELTPDSEYFKWVDRRVVIEHEKRFRAEVLLSQTNKELERLKAKYEPETVEKK